MNESVSRAKAGDETDILRYDKTILYEWKGTTVPSPLECDTFLLTCKPLAQRTGHWHIKSPVVMNKYFKNIIAAEK